MSDKRRPLSCIAYGRLAIGLTVAAVLAVAPVDAVGRTPRAVVEALADEVLKILRDDALSSDRKRTRIESIVYENVDVRTVSRLVLARHWRSFSEQQQEQFVEEFKQHLSHTYGRNVDDYNNEELEILGEREESRGDRTVQTKILRNGGADVFVDYRLRQTEGGWKIIDVVVERVSLIANFRSQFQEILSNGGPEKLLRLLREKNAKGEGAEDGSRES